MRNFWRFGPARSWFPIHAWKLEIWMTWRSVDSTPATRQAGHYRTYSGGQYDQNSLGFNDDFTDLSVENQLHLTVRLVRRQFILVWFASQSLKAASAPFIAQVPSVARQWQDHVSIYRSIYREGCTAPLIVYNVYRMQWLNGSELKGMQMKPRGFQDRQRVPTGGISDTRRN